VLRLEREGVVEGLWSIVGEGLGGMKKIDSDENCTFLTVQNSSNLSETLEQ